MYNLCICCAFMWGRHSKSFVEKTYKYFMQALFYVCLRQSKFTRAHYNLYKPKIFPSNRSKLISFKNKPVKIGTRINIKFLLKFVWNTEDIIGSLRKVNRDNSSNLQFIQVEND